MNVARNLIPSRTSRTPRRKEARQRHTLPLQTPTKKPGRQPLPHASRLQLAACRATPEGFPLHRRKPSFMCSGHARRIPLFECAVCTQLALLLSLRETVKHTDRRNDRSSDRPLNGWRHKSCSLRKPASDQRRPKRNNPERRVQRIRRHHLFSCFRTTAAHRRTACLRAAL